MSSPALIVLNHAGHRLGALGYAEGYAYHAAGKHVPDSAKDRIHDRRGIGGRQHSAVDFSGGGQSVELTAELRRHRIERAGELLELVAAVYGHPAGEIPLRDPLGALLQLFQRQHAAPDLAGAEQQHRHAGKSDHNQERVGKLHHWLEYFVFGLAEQHGPWLAGKGGIERYSGAGGQIVLFGSGRARVYPSLVGQRLRGPRSALRRTEQHSSQLIQHRHPGIRRGHALFHRAPQIVRADLAHEGSSHFPFSGQPSQQVHPRPAAEVHYRHQGQAQPEIGAVSGAQARTAREPAEHFYAPVVVTYKLDCYKSLAREEVQPRDQSLAGFDEVYPGPAGWKAGSAIDDDSTHGYPPIQRAGLSLISELGPGLPHGCGNPGKALGGGKLKNCTGGNTLEGGVEQQQALEYRLA